MKRLARWYGANPLHLLALLGCFALAGYAAAQLVKSHPLAVAVWFLGAVIGHDLLLMPLYSLADRSALAAIRHRPPRLPAVPWINYLRVPAGLSGLLLLIWFPLILRRGTQYHASTTLSPDPFLWHWLAVTGALFLLSAVLLALRLRRTLRHRHRHPPPAAPAPPPATPDTAPAGSPAHPAPHMTTLCPHTPQPPHPEPALPAPQTTPATSIPPHPSPGPAAGPVLAR